ncbi:hypothetical protein EZS27_037070, partial [termite gut metagenome]
MKEEQYPKDFVEFLQRWLNGTPQGKVSPYLPSYL